MNIFRKIVFIIIDLPFISLRDLTIPSVEIEKWNRNLFIISPITSTLFIIGITKTYNFFLNLNLLINIGILSILLIISIIFCKFTYRNKLPYLISLLCIFSFIMSICWIWLISNMLVSILELIGVIFDLTKPFLAMTILSIGNSLPDLALNTQLARSGLGEMGLAGSIAGPLFNLLVGLGIVLIRLTIKDGSIGFILYSKGDYILLIPLGVLVLNFVRLLIQASIMDFKLTKWVSIIGCLLYVGYLVGIFLITCL